MASRHTPSIPVATVVPAASSAPPTARHEAVPSLGDLFLNKVSDQFAVESIVHEMVEGACAIHVDNEMESVAIEYTACALWAEMVKLVSGTVVAVDPGYRSATELAASVGSRSISEHHHDPWRPDAPPARVITEEHSRRVVDIRPAVAKEAASAPGSKRRRPEGSRPASSQSSTMDDSQARALLARGSVKPSSRGSMDLALTQSVRVGGVHSPTRPMTKTHSKITGKTSPLRSDVDPQVGPNHLSLSQPDFASDEAEVRLHQEMLSKVAQIRDESQKKAARIQKALNDPKTAPKNFTIDKNGNVISVLHIDDNRVAAQSESLSPRFVVPQQPQPPPAPEVTVARPARNASQRDGRDDKKRSPREGRKEEGFVSTDARDIPMQIKVMPSGGVMVKEANTQRTAELKVPSTKMSKTEFLRLRGALAPIESAPTVTEPMIEQSTIPDREAQLLDPIKRPLPATTAKKPESKAETARRQSVVAPGVAIAAPQSARVQAPAPPPKRDVANRAMLSRKTQIEAIVPTRHTDRQLSELAGTWQGQRTTNEGRGTRVVVSQAFETNDDYGATL